MIQFRCSCGRQLQAREEVAGRQIACPVCGQVQVVPAAPEPRPAGPPSLPEAEERVQERPEGQKRRRPAADEGFEQADEWEDRGEPAGRERRPRRAPATSGKAIASLVLGVLAFPCLCNVFTGLPAILLGLLAVRDVKGSQGRLAGSGLAIGGIVTGCLGFLWLLLAVPLWWQYDEASNRRQAQNNLKQIALALFNYHDSFQRFPPAGVGDPRAPAGQDNGKPLLSWRVAILPFIEQQNLYQQFKHDEPWDSAHNMKLLPLMPRTYALPGQKMDGTTFFQVFVGPQTAFPATKGRRITEITDGTSNTFGVVESAAAVPWTKPDDIPFDPGKPLPPLGGHFGKVFLVSMMDGSVRAIPIGTPPTTLRDAITCNDGRPLFLP